MQIKQAIKTLEAPAPSGTYSQAIKVGNTVYFAGQIPLDPLTGELANGIEAQVEQVFKNLEVVAQAAGGDFSAFVKLNVFLTDLKNFPFVNAAMTKYFSEPYPARSTIEVSALPKGSLIEIEGIMVV